MSRVFDDLLVALALLASAGYALSSLGPKSLRRRMWAALARLAARAPGALRSDRLARRLHEAAAGGAQSGCGGCGSCGSEQSDADKPAVPEVRVPVAKIGRRD